jgi:hypothetical protein
MPAKKDTKASLREREIYNEAIRDAMKEVWLYDGLIQDNDARAYLCREVQKKLSYKQPAPKPLILIS